MLARVNFHAVLDGELIVKSGDEIASFNHLQQRLNRKSPDPKLMAKYPGHLILYDMLAVEGRDLRPLPLTERKRRWRAGSRMRSPWAPNLPSRLRSKIRASCKRCEPKPQSWPRRISRASC